MICVPKSTLSNWLNELARWCPALRVIKFHGSREDREYMIDNYFTQEAASHDGKRPDKEVMNEKGELIDDNSDNPRTWDVCVTTYEVCNNERKVFQRFAWKYLIIDEAHRLVRHGWCPWGGLGAHGTGSSSFYFFLCTLYFVGTEKRCQYVQQDRQVV